MRLVCVGDSFTEGIADDTRPDGEYLGWADRVASALATTDHVEYANLAVRGKLLDQVARDQLRLAEQMAPDVLTFHAGGNDVLRRGADLPAIFRRYDAAIARVAHPDRRILLFTSVTRTGGTGRVAEALASRFTAFNDNVRTVAQRHGAAVVDIGAVPALTDRRLWHADRLHLNAAGHTRVAAAVLEILGITDPHLLGGRPGWWSEPLPPVESRNRREELVADVLWAWDYLTPWIWRRLRGVSSGDGRVSKDTELGEPHTLS